MADPHVITALVKKRGDLAGELAEIDKRRHAVADRIADVDSVLAMFGYREDPKTIPARRKQTGRIFKRGQLRRLIYDLHRERPELTVNRDIAVEVMRRLEMDVGNATLLASVAQKVKDVRKVIGR